MERDSTPYDLRPAAGQGLYPVNELSIDDDDGIAQ